MIGVDPVAQEGGPAPYELSYLPLFAEHAAELRGIGHRAAWFHAGTEGDAVADTGQAHRVIDAGGIDGTVRSADDGGQAERGKEAAGGAKDHDAMETIQGTLAAGGNPQTISDRFRA